jgi:hypothetical protein
MTPDYDLSDLAKSQAELWLYLHTDAIRAQIFFDNAASEELGDSQQRSALRVWPQTKIPKPPAPGPVRFVREN